MDESATTPREDAETADETLRSTGGRHRWLRRRMATTAAVSASATETSAEPVATTEPAVTETPTEETDSEPSADDVIEPPAIEPELPGAKRRRWFGRRRATVPAVEPVSGEPAEAVGEPTDEAESPVEEVEVTDSATEEGDDTAAPVEAVDDEPKQTRPRPLRKWHVAVAASAAVLFVGAAAFSGAMMQPYLADRAVVDTKMDIARTAANAVTTFWTYTPEDMDQLPARAAPYLGGNLKDSFLKQVDGFVAASKQYQVTRNTEVIGAAVESLDGPNATAMVYANITYTSSATKGIPTFNLTSFRLQMHRTSDGWVITSMPTVTSKEASQIVG